MRDQRQQDVLRLAVELEAQAGFKLTRRFFLGAYVSGGPAMPGRRTVDSCAGRATCKGSSGRAGLMARVDLEPGGVWNPWLGAGSGVEAHRVDVEVVPFDGGLVSPSAPPTQELRFSGWEVLRLMAGVDYRSSRTFGFGFFGAISAGGYGRVTSAGGPNLVADRSVREPHGWLTIGVRGVVFP